MYLWYSQHGDHHGMQNRGYDRFPLNRSLPSFDVSATHMKSRDAPGQDEQPPPFMKTLFAQRAPEATADTIGDEATA